MHTRIKRLLLLALMFALLFGGAGQAVQRLHSMRVRYGLTNEPLKGVSPQLALATQALAWGRGIIIDVIWIRMEALKRQGRFFELVQLARWACDLAPRIPAVWDIQAWNMAYNVSCQIDYLPDRWAWVWKAIELLRDEGIPANPNSPELYQSLAWTIFHKIGEQDDNAHPFYKQRLAELMQVVLGGGGDEPTLKALAAAPHTREELLQDADVRRLVDRCAALGFDIIDGFFEILYDTPSVPAEVKSLIREPANRQAANKVAVFARARRLREKYKMDPQRMLELRKTYRDSEGHDAPFDWRSPYPHAIYWATLGLEVLDRVERRLYDTAEEFGFSIKLKESRGPGDIFGPDKTFYEHQRVQLKRIVYYAMQSLVARGRVLFDAKGRIMLDYGTDYRFADAALPLFEEAIEEFSERYANTTKDAFINFLANGVLEFHFMGQQAKSLEYYKLLSEKFPQVVEKFDGYDDFLQEQLRLFTSAMTYSDARQLVRGYIYRAMIARAANEEDHALALEKEAREIAEHWVDSDSKALRSAIRYDKIRESVIVEFLTGRVRLAAPELENLKRLIGEKTVARILQNVQAGATGAPKGEEVEEPLRKDPTRKPVFGAPQH